MVSSGVLDWLVNDLFPVFGNILGLIASFGSASFDQAYLYFTFFFDISPFTWTYTNLFTGASISIPELGTLFNIPILSDIISFINNGVWSMIYNVVNAFGLTKAPFALAFVIPFVLLMVVIGLFKFFARIINV